MKRINLKCKTLSPNQRRIRLQELSGIPITEKQKKRILNESVSMVLPKPKHLRDSFTNSMIWNGNDISDIEDEEEVDLDEILKEMGYGESEDLGDDFESDVEEDETISNMSKSELKQMIQGIVLDTMEEEDDLNEIIENITKNY